MKTMCMLYWLYHFYLNVIKRRMCSCTGKNLSLNDCLYGGLIKSPLKIIHIPVQEPAPVLMLMAIGPLQMRLSWGCWDYPALFRCAWCNHRVLIGGREEVREEKRCLAASFEDWRKEPRNAGGLWKLKTARKRILP